MTIFISASTFAIHSTTFSSSFVCPILVISPAWIKMSHGGRPFFNGDSLGPCPGAWECVSEMSSSRVFLILLSFCAIFCLSSAPEENITLKQRGKKFTLMYEDVKKSKCVLSVQEIWSKECKKCNALVNGKIPSPTLVDDSMATFCRQLTRTQAKCARAEE